MGAEDPQEDRQHKAAAFKEYYEHSGGKEKIIMCNIEFDDQVQKCSI